MDMYPLLADTFEDGIYVNPERWERAPSEEPLGLVSTIDGRYQKLRPEYAQLFSTMQIKPGWTAITDRVARQIITWKPIYQAITKATINTNNPSGVPWQFIAVIHHMEGNSNFKTHLHNGDPLSGKTYHVPAGRIPNKAPPYTFAESCLDALKMDGYTDINEWSVAHMAYLFERYNGMGYRSHGVNSPYLWSGTNNYSHGRYVADGVWSDTSVSQQLGCMPLLSRIMALDISPMQINQGSRKLTLMNRLRTAFFSLFGGWFTVDKLGLVPDYINNYKALGLTPLELALIGSAIIGWIGLAVFEYMSHQDYANNTYTPSQSVENSVTMETKP